MAPLIGNVAYCYSSEEERAYEVETTYYLEYHILSALYSLDKLENYEANSVSSLFSNKCQYYHLYCDHLLFSVGQIANRFKQKRKKKNVNNTKDIEEYNEFVEEYNEHIKSNIINYGFIKKEYKYLSNKDPRNLIEHIDERNMGVIKKSRAVGGFNCIDFDSPKELINSLKNNREAHVYTLDLIEKKLLLTSGKKQYDIELSELKRELTSLLSNVRYFKTFLDF